MRDREHELEARKYRLSLILANQYLGQLEEMSASGRNTKVKDAVFGNVGTIIVFRVGAEDAEFLEPEFSPDILIEDFVNLGKYQIYLKLMIDGIASAPFSAETMPPIDRPPVTEKQKIIAASRERYSVERAVIEDKIAKWTGEISQAVAARPLPQGQGGNIAMAQPAAKMYDIVCSMCGKQTKVIFEPEPGRKVFCKTCLKKMQTSGVPKPSGGDSRPLPAPRPAEEPKEPAPRLSLGSLAASEVVKFSGQKSGQSPAIKPKKEVQMDELRKALQDALKKNPPNPQQ